MPVMLLDLYFFGLSNLNLLDCQCSVVCTYLDFKVICDLILQCFASLLLYFFLFINIIVNTIYLLSVMVEVVKYWLNQILELKPGFSHIANKKFFQYFAAGLIVNFKVVQYTHSL